MEQGSAEVQPSKGLMGAEVLTWREFVLIDWLPYFL